MKLYFSISGIMGKSDVIFAEDKLSEYLSLI